MKFLARIIVSMLLLNLCHAGIEANPFLPSTKEQIPVQALQLVGILREGSTIWALIREPNGQISHVSKGQNLGNHFRKVIAIDDTSLVLEEKVEVFGQWKKRRRRLRLGSAF